MVEEPNGIRRPPEDPADFLRIVPELEQFAAEFDFAAPLNKDSIDMVTSDWATIAKAIYTRRNAGYAGFVVVHGVDTMAFGASAVAFALGANLNFPVVFVGGQTVAKSLHGDSKINLLRACRVALTDLAEVAICFNNSVYRGCRAQKKDDRDFDAFESPGFPVLCHIKDTFDLASHAKVKKTYPEGEQEPDIELRNTFWDGILTVPITPATPPQMLLPAIESEKCRGIVLQSFGGGNLPEAEVDFKYLPLVEHATAIGKPVIVTSLFPADPTEYLVYESGINARNAGAIQISGLVLPALVAKFSWVLPQIDDLGRKERMNALERLMRTPCVGELSATPGFGA